MRVLAANLKHFYQCRGLWFWYFILIGPSLMVVLQLKRPAPGSLVDYGFISFFLGVLAAGLQRDVLTKPFSFCMPEHRGWPRRIILGIGGIANLLFGMFFVRYHGLEFPHILLVILAAGFAGMIVYLLPVWFVLVSKAPAPSSFAGYFIIMVVSFEYKDTLDCMIVSSPLQPIMAGILACGIAWKWLRGESLARKFCGENLVELADSWNFAKARRYQQRIAARRLSKRGSGVFDRLEEFFLTRIKKCRPFDANRYVVGNLYIMLGKFLAPRRMIDALTLIGVPVFLGYMADTEVVNFLFILPAFTAMQIDLIPYRNILLPSGRTEKYYTAMVSGLVVTVLLTSLVALIAAMTVPLSLVMPDITWKGSTHAFYVIDVGKSYLCLFLTPIALIFGTMFHKKKVSAIIFVGVVTGATVFYMYRATVAPLLFPGSMLGDVILIAASWIGSVMLLGYYCRKRSLVGQGR